MEEEEEVVLGILIGTGNCPSAAGTGRGSLPPSEGGVLARGGVVAKFGDCDDDVCLDEVADDDVWCLRSSTALAIGADGGVTFFDDLVCKSPYPICTVNSFDERRLNMFCALLRCLLR